MHNRGPYAVALVAVVGLLVSALPASAAGFAIFEHGSKAMGMAGAFTAQADDPSAMFHNPAGLAFQRERDVLVGTTVIVPTSDFQGAAPFPGPGVTEEQADDLLFVLPHLYLVQPFGNLTFGLGVNSPFGLTTEWENPDTFSGRYIATRTQLRTVDLNPTLAWQVGPNFGIGVGAIARFTDVDLQRRVPFINPFTQTVQDAAAVRLESDVETGYGFTAGLLHKVNNSFSYGLSYRSKIDVDYNGEARFFQRSTGNPVLDASIAQTIPFDRNPAIETGVEFPDMASLGLLFAITPNVSIETDVNWTGWSTFEEIDLRFVDDPEFSQVIPEDYEDVYNYRVGLKWQPTSTAEWRFGYVYDETPQPEQSVSPLLPDNDRDGFTVGYGYRGGWEFDIAFMYLDFGTRTRDESFPGEGDYFGSYDTTAYLLGLSLGF